MLCFCKFLHHLHIDKFLYLYSVLHLVNRLCILNTVTVPKCCLEEFHCLLCTIVNKCHLLLPVLYDYTESFESKVAMYYLNYSLLGLYIYIYIYIYISVTGIGSGVCRGSDTPTIYVEDIDMYIPLEKSNT